MMIKIKCIDCSYFKLLIKTISDIIEVGTNRIL